MKYLEKLFVPCNEAIELYNIGLSESIINEYLGMYHICNNDGLKDIYGKDYFFCEKSSNFNSGCQQIKAPLYSQAFDFFIEKYNLDGWVVPYYTLDSKLYSYIIESINQNGNIKNFENTEPDNFNTKQEAEYACIKHLIKIIKSKIYE